MSQSRLTTARVRFALLLLAATAFLPACNIGGAAFYLLHGPPRTPAMYELQDVPTVVFVDDRSNTIPRNADQMRRQIAETVSVELMKNDCLTQTIRPQDAMAIAKQYDRTNQIIPIDALGRAVGADQVIYIDMLAFIDTPDNYTPRPGGACKLKVIDTKNQTRLFPGADADQPFHFVETTMPPQSTELYASSASRVQVFEMLAVFMGDEIAKTFYSHETKELGGQLGGR